MTVEVQEVLVHRSDMVRPLVLKRESPCLLHGLPRSGYLAVPLTQ